MVPRQFLRKGGVGLLISVGPLSMVLVWFTYLWPVALWLPKRQLFVEFERGHMTVRSPFLRDAGMRASSGWHLTSSAAYAELVRVTKQRWMEQLIGFPTAYSAADCAIINPTQVRLWWPAGALAAGSGLVVLLAVVSRNRICSGHCPRCRYDLRGLPSNARCPECGEVANTA